MANFKKRALSLLMAVMMMLTALPMNAIALEIPGLGNVEDLSDVVELAELLGKGKLVCEDENHHDHGDDCYATELVMPAEHTEKCYHKHSEPVYLLNKLIAGCEYACTEHIHSVANGCPVADCTAHGHDAECCKVEEHSHNISCCTREMHIHSWLIGCYKLTCSRKTGIFAGHFHGESCYSNELVCSKEPHDHVTGGCICGKGEHDHTSGCDYSDCTIDSDHIHGDECFSCEIPAHEHKATCERLCGKAEGLICNGVHDKIQVTTLVCTKEEHNENCYVTLEVIKEAFAHLQSAEEIAASAYAFGKCWLDGGKCGISYKLGEVELNLCEEHFCSLCDRLHSYCECVEITFANIGNIADNTKVIKVKAGESVDVSKVPNAELINFRFLGWFDADGNEFNAETIYTEDITFTAQYKALTEAEKLENTINFIKNNFNLGAELGRMITILSKGEITKDNIVGKKDETLGALELYLLTNQLTGKISSEQAREIIDLMKQSDEYTTLFTEWLWPADAVLMPEFDQIMSNIDFEKLAVEIKEMIFEKYGIDFDENWIDNNRALAEQYIAEALAEVKSITEAQKQFVLDQIREKKEQAALVMAMIRCEMFRAIKNEIENAKEAVRETIDRLLADTGLGIKLGKNIFVLSGLTNDTAMNYGAEFKKALIAALELTSLTEEQKDALVSILDENDGMVVDFIDWLWPEVTVYWMNGGKILEKDVVAFDAKHVYDGATPIKLGNDEFTYIFTGWQRTEENGDIVYYAVFASEINEYTITWMNGETVLSADSVPYGTTPVYTGETPVKEGNAQYSYTFAGWDKEVAAVTGDATYTAVFEESVNNYVVTFVVDGVETTVTYAYGEMPAHADPVKAGDAAFTYKFIGWDKAFAPVTGNETYTAQFEAIPVIYTVTWVVNGEVVETDSVTYGTMPEYNGAVPAMDGGAQYTYTFTGWNAEFTPVTENVTYTALFASEINEYTITFVDEDGTVLETKTVPYGETPVYTGATPVKADTAEFDYEFTGFGTVAAVTGDATYTAQYSATVRAYRVTFMDGETVIYSEMLNYGTKIEAPALPTRKGWDSKWNTAFSTVTGNLTVTVEWSYKTFEKHDLMIYIGWGESATDSTLNWYAAGKGKIYDARNYYSYYVDGKYAGSTVMTEGTDYQSYTAALGEITINGITYGNETGKDFYVINEYVVVATKAQYHLDCHADLYHTVTFVDYNGNVIDTITVKHGETVTAPEVSRKGYVFAGWDKDLSAVAESMEVTAQYDYEYVASARLKINVGNGTPASGSTKGNVLSHWGKIYNARSVYSYYDYPNYKSDSIMSNEDFDYDRTIANATPRTVKYDGVTYTNGEGTSDNYYVITGATFVACRGEYHLDYKVDFYNVYTFVVNGVETKVTALSGFEPEMPADPVMDGYEFDGWVIDENGVYNAKFTKLHKVKIVNAPGYNQTILVRDGETIVLPFDQPTRTGYYCAGWYHYRVQDPKKESFDFNTPVTCDMELSPKWEYSYADRDMTVFAIINGERVELGMGTIENFRHPKTFGYAVVADKDYRNASFVLPNGDITVDGITYTYGAESGANGYTLTVKNLEVIKVSTGSKYAFECEVEVELYHRVTFNLPGSGGKYVVYVREGEKLDEFWAEDACLAFEEVNYWYNGKGGAKLDFATYVVTQAVSFSCKTKAKMGDWDVALKGTLNGETFELGTAVANDAEHAGNYRNDADRYDLPAENFDIAMSALNAIVVDGVTYTYGEGSSDNYYTVEFTALSCYSIRNSKNKVVDWEYHYTGEIELFHSNVTVWLNSRKIPMNNVAHGTVINNDWLIANGYTSFVVVEEVVINESGEYHVNCAAK